MLLGTGYWVLGNGSNQCQKELPTYLPKANNPEPSTQNQEPDYFTLTGDQPLAENAEKINLK